MTATRRVDPRRKATPSASGVSRIVVARRDAASVVQGAAKPRRTTMQITRWHMAIVSADRGSLDAHARQAIAAAALLAGEDCGVVAAVLGAFEGDAASLGADRTLVLHDVDTARFEPERVTSAVGAIIREHAPHHVFLADKPDGDGDLGRRLVAAHGESFAAHATEIDTSRVRISWPGATGLVGERALPRFILVDAGIADPDLPFCGATERETLHVAELAASPSVRIRDCGLETTDAATIALDEADVVVSAGNGVRNVATLQALAKALGAAVGASRVAVDSGRLAKSQQIGATGKTVSASAYLAVGISGAVQHLQGIKDCRHVIAINRDPSAPIVKRADLTVIADAEELMQALLAEIERRRQANGENP